MKEQNNMLRFFCGVIAVAVALMVIVLCNVLPLSEDTARFLVDKSKQDGVNYLAEQNFMWIAFFLALAEMMLRLHRLNLQRGELGLGFLPESPEIVLTQKSMPQIHRTVIDNDGTGILANMVRLLASQFQISRSVSMCSTVLSNQVEIESNQIDQGYGMVRYFVWVIPTLGFIGTVRGILNALGKASAMSPTDPNLLPTVISNLSTAFWTTLLALLMSCLIMLLMHIVQGREEAHLNECTEYCLRNFINRLYEK